MRFEISEVIKQEAVMELVFGNCDNPGRLLGRHMVKSGQVISAFHPDARSMEIIDGDGNHYPMDQVERQPMFAVYLPNKRRFPYQIRMTFADGNTYTSEDPYCMESQISDSEIRLFHEGNWKNAYRKMGSHLMTIQGVSGAYFVLWAPMARRVSVVGDFNYWNGMIYPMQRIDDSDLFEIFIPGVQAGQLYKYEIKNWQGDIYQKKDPYAVMNEQHEDGASVIMDLDLFPWDDGRWLSSRNIRDIHSKPLAICEMFEPELTFPEERLREIVTQMGLSHIILKGRPRAEKPVSDEIMGIVDRETEKTRHKGFFEPMYSRDGPDRTRLFVNECHKNNKAVLTEFTSDYIQKAFDYILEFADLMPEGTSEGLTRLIEETGYTYLFYRSPELFNYLLSNLIFWIRKYHIDGFVFRGFHDKLAAMCASPEFEDISNKDWTSLVQRHYDLTRSLMAAAREVDPGVLFIGESIGREELFRHCSWVRDLNKPDYDIHWDYSVKKSMVQYLGMDPAERKRNHYLLSLPVMRMDDRDTVIRLNHEWRKMASTVYSDARALAEEKVTYAYLAGIPGKPVWTLHANQSSYSLRFARDLLKQYLKNPTFYDYDLRRDAFEWVNAMDARESVITFLRKDSRARELFLFVCNFDEEEKRGYRIGVPKKGLYQIIMNSDSVEYGGEGRYEGQEYQAEEIFCDMKEYSIKVYLPPMAALIFRFRTNRRF